MKQIKKGKFFILGLVPALVSVLLFTACVDDKPFSNSALSGDDTTASVAESGFNDEDSVSNNDIDKEDDEKSGTNGKVLSKQDAADFETADFEGYIENVNLPDRSFTISIIEQGAFEGMMIVDLEGDNINIVYNENTVFIKSVSNNAEKTTDYFQGTDNDLKAGVFVKVCGSEANGVVNASKVLVMTS